MTKALLVLPILLAACAEAPGELAAPTTAPLAFTTLGDGSIVATGGYQVVAIADRAQAGLSATASDGYDVEPVGGAWPNMVSPEYHVRALAAGSGAFAIATSHGIASGILESADVARIALVPVDYALAGNYHFIVDPARPELAVALFDNRGRRLVDGSLRVAGAPQTAWDRITVTAATTITITADSIAPVTLPLQVGGEIDRIDEVGSCLHAYRGELEVVSAQLVAQRPSRNAVNCW